MVRSRKDFRDILVKALPVDHSSNMYFQPPSNVKMRYPCIVYNLMSPDTRKANNSLYILENHYRVTVIDRNPDTEIPINILNLLPKSKIIDRSIVDNLHNIHLDVYF